MSVVQFIRNMFRLFYVPFIRVSLAILKEEKRVIVIRTLNK